MSRLRAAYLAGDSMGKFENIIGRRFGRLTVISDEGTDGHYHYWRCQCDCGKEIVARTASLKNGNTKSCGCIRVDIAKKARENQKFNSEVSSFIQHDRVDGTRISTLKRKSVRADNSSGCTGVNWDKNRSMWNMRQVKDGWHTASGYNVYVENGKIIRGVEGEDLTRVPVYPYRWMPSANAWSNERMTMDAFRAGIKRGTVTMK